ncbi:hypothetical protein CFOL_v3_16230 [Cephalotus follicularis]|uniref:Uncharacterized protein n=1 Tax=Cephalotus follicularis TaxID=3775 RepID=A0A1Q3BXY8_CEPFO|nr:hypothetical protein CFOL_v3_16230 [Cephalotus follicularis]
MEAERESISEWVSSNLGRRVLGDIEREVLRLEEGFSKFKQFFVLFSNATIVSPTTRLEASPELIFSLLESDKIRQKIGAKHTLDCLINGVKKYENKWLTGLILFLLPRTVI